MRLKEVPKGVVGEPASHGTGPLAVEEAAPGPERAALRVLLAVETGSLPLDSAEFLKLILPPGSSVRLLTVTPYQFHADSPWGTLDHVLRADQGPDPIDFQIALRILESVGAQVSVTNRSGFAPDEILSEAADWGASLIIVGHNNGLGRWFLGSVVENLLKRSLVPVLAVPQLTSASPGRCIAEGI